MVDETPPSTPFDMAVQQRDSMLGIAFPTTEWSMVLRLQAEGIGSVNAMNDLCRRYWYPIYAYLRCRNFERADAQDITQSFFLKAVTTGLFEAAEQGRGRLRSFLLGSLNRHVSDYLRHENAQKRGGRAIVLPIECENAETRFGAELIEHDDPESLYLATWAKELIQRAKQRLRAHYASSKRARLFDALEAVVLGDETATTYGELAAQLNTSDAALRLQVFRMRQRFAKLLREEVALTVETPEEIEEELAWLARVLRS